MDHERSMSSTSRDGADGGEKIDEIILPGFRFHPTDEELVGFYLKRKIQQRPLSIELIKQLDIYKYDPWDLPKMATTGDKEWYFYCPRDRKYRNSTRPNRVTGAGFWKATGTDRPIYSSEGSKCIGLKKSLVFYKGRAARGVKTDWMMHEFRLPSVTDSSSPPKRSFIDKNIPVNESWAICRIFKKTSSTAQRSVSHSNLVSPSPTTSCGLTYHLFSSDIDDHDHHHSTSLATKTTLTSPNPFSSNFTDILQHPSLTNIFPFDHHQSHFGNYSFQKPNNQIDRPSSLDHDQSILTNRFVFPPIETISTEQAKISMDVSSMLLNTSSSENLHFDSSVINGQYGSNYLLPSLTQDEIQEHINEENRNWFLKYDGNNNNMHAGHEQWEAVGRSNDNNSNGGGGGGGYSSFGLPLNNILGGDAWKTYNSILWEANKSVSCPSSDVSSSLSATKCYT